MAKKLPSHITKLKNGKFRVRYQKSQKYPIEYDESFDTLDKAIRANDEYIAKNTLKLHKQIKKMGFSDFCDYYLDWLRKKPKKPAPRTIRTYKQYINILKIAIGNLDITEIDSVFLTNILDKESKREKRGNGKQQGGTISSNTLHHEYIMLNTLFNKAYKWNFISVNPMNDIEAPEVEIKKIEVPEFEEIKNIEAKIMKAPIRERCQFLLGFYTGKREEEVAGQHMYRDINIDCSETYVNTVIVQDEYGNYIEDDPKSKKSIRTIPLPPEFKAVYEEYLEYRKNFVNYLKAKNPNYVEIPNLFLNKDGEFYRPYRISRTWSKFAKENDIPLNFHGLRHYYITNQANYNDDLTDRDLQEIAGHADIRTTQLYIHSSKKKIKENATNIFKAFSRNSLYQDNDNTLTIPIEHIASIVIGKSELSKIDELKITLEEISKKEIDFFNLSNVIEECKEYIVSNNPSLIRLEKYKYSNEDNEKIIKDIKKQFGNVYKIVDNSTCKN